MSINRKVVRNLLTALIAYQSGLITREQLLEAIRIWVDDKERDIAQVLHDQGAFGEDLRELLTALAAKQLAIHNEEPMQSLGALTSISDSLADALKMIDDPEVNQTMTEAATAYLGNSSRAAGAGTQPKPQASDSRFSVIRPHARGGLGEVFVALDHELNRQVALKEIQGKYSFDADSRMRFMQEAEITGGLEHPGIVPVYGLGTYDDGRPFYAMRFIKGMSLAEAASEFHAARQPIGPGDYLGVDFRQLLRRFVDVCHSIEYAHSRGVLHRDLKPGNIMLGKYGETLVVDWGLAKAIGRRGDAAEASEEETLRPSSSGDSSHTRLGQAVGTPMYMSPEAASGQLEEVGVASDVFCLGSTLYHVMTGKAPYASTGKRKLEAVMKGAFPPPRQLQKAIPPALEAICLRAMSTRPQDRYASAKALADEVELWLADEPVSAFQEGLGKRLSRFVKRNKTLVSTAAALGIAILVGSLAYSSMIAKKNNQLQQAYQDVLAQEEVARLNADTARGIAFNILDIAEKQLTNFQGQEGFREQLMERTYELFSDSYAEQPDDDEITWELARVSRIHGNLKLFLKKTDEGKRLLDESIQLQTKLAKPDRVSRNYLAETYRDLGSWGKSAGDLQTAAESLGQANAILDGLLVDAPDDQDLKRTAATIDMERVGFYHELINHEAALASATRCETAFVELASSEVARDLDYVIAMLATSRRGQALTLLDRPEEARVVYTEGLARGKQWLERSSSVDLRYAVARTLLYFSTDLCSTPAVLERSVPEDADSLIDEALERLTILVETRQSLTYRYYLTCAQRTKALVEESRGRHSDAMRILDEAIAQFEAIVAEKDSSNHHNALAEAHFKKFLLLRSAGETEGLRAACEQAVAHQRLSVEQSPESLLGRRTLLEFEQELATLLP